MGQRRLGCPELPESHSHQVGAANRPGKGSRDAGHAQPEKLRAAASAARARSTVGVLNSGSIGPCAERHAAVDLPTGGRSGHVVKRGRRAEATDWIVILVTLRA